LSTIAFTSGFYTYAAIQQRLELLIPAAIVFAGLTWAGSGADFLGLLNQWYNNLQQEKKTPTLEYDDIVEISYDYLGHNSKEIHSRQYLLGISNIRKVGIVNRCHAFLYLEGNSDVRHVHVLWFHSNEPYYDLSVYGEIELFRTTDLFGGKRVFFHPRQLNVKPNIIEENTIPYEQIKDKKLTIIVAADNGNMPNEYFHDTLENIIKKSVLK
jgi:hypothetical protein